MLRLTTVLLRLLTSNLFHSKHFSAVVEQTTDLIFTAVKLRHSQQSLTCNGAFKASNMFFFV